MKPRLINVRLDPDRLRKARKLREKGVVLSDLVREAIDAKFAALGELPEARDAKEMIAGLFERYPDPADLPPREDDVHKRRAARAAIQRKLRGRRG